MSRECRSAVLITGGGRRIGRAVALALAEDGFDIALHYHRSGVAAASTARSIRKSGVDCDIFKADLQDTGDVIPLLAAVYRRFPQLAVLLNSASVFIPSGLGIEDLGLLEKHWNVHIKAPWLLTSEFARLVQQGVVINFLDTAIIKNATNFGAYLLSKKALAELTRMQAVQFAPGVRVNAVAPGLILAPEGQKAGYLKERVPGVPLKRVGNVAHVVQSVRFLIGNDYVTGQTIFVDGGAHLV